MNTSLDSCKRKPRFSLRKWDGAIMYHPSVGANDAVWITDTISYFSKSEIVSLLNDGLQSSKRAEG